LLIALLDPLPGGLENVLTGAKGHAVASRATSPVASSSFALFHRELIL
jgi:hypothetical protein